MSENQEQKSQPNNTKAGDAQNRQITVDGGMMVVQEVRKVELKKGLNIVQAEGVPNNVNKSSIMALIRSDTPGSVKSKTFRPAERVTPQRIFDELMQAGAKVDVNYTTPHRLQTYNANRIICGTPNEFAMARPNGETMICRNPEAIHTKHPLREL